MVDHMRGLLQRYWLMILARSTLRRCWSSKKHQTQLIKPKRSHIMNWKTIGNLTLAYDSIPMVSSQVKPESPPGVYRGSFSYIKHRSVIMDVGLPLDGNSSSHSQTLCLAIPRAVYSSHTKLEFRFSCEISVVTIDYDWHRFRCHQMIKMSWVLSLELTTYVTLLLVRLVARSDIWTPRFELRRMAENVVSSIYDPPGRNDAIYLNATGRDNSSEVSMV